MSYVAYVCQIGCDSECRHRVPCAVFAADAEHPHPPKHIGFDADDNAHEWRGKGTGRCDVSALEEDQQP